MKGEIGPAGPQGPIGISITGPPVRISQVKNTEGNFILWILLAGGMHWHTHALQSGLCDLMCEIYLKCTRV